MEQEQQGPQNTIQFLTMMISSIIKGLPQMIKSMIITSIISGVVTLAAHFYLILVPNDGYNTGDPMLTPILVLANVRPTPPNVLLFWFLGNYIFWMIVGTFKEHGIVGGIKQFVTTPIFAINGLRESGFGAFPMLMGGLGFAFLMRLWILGTMTTLQMFLMMIGVLVSQSNSITLIGMDLFFTDIRKLVNRGKEIESNGIGLPTTLILGSIVGFAYLVFFPYNVQMVQILLALMLLGIIGMFVQGRKKGVADNIALALMLICVISLMAIPVNADDGGAAETGGAMNVINNAGLRDFMIKQGINPALAGIAASIAASGKMTPDIFKQLKSGKIDPRKAKTIQEMQTLQNVRTKLLKNLQHMDHEIWFGKANKLWKGKDEPGNVRKHIDGLIDDIIHGREVDINKYGQIHRVYTGHVSGRTIVEGDLPPAGQVWRDTISNGMYYTTYEVMTGATIDGQTSYKSMVLRGLVGYMTGGATEYVYVPTNMVHSLKNYSDQGGDSIIGGMWHLTKEGVKQVVIGKVIGGVTGGVFRGVGATGKYLATKFPNVARGLSKGFDKMSKTLNKKITFGRGTTPGVPGGRPTIGQIRGQQSKDFNTKVTDRIMKNKHYQQSKKFVKTGEAYPGVKNPTFKPAGVKADLRGMTPQQVKGLRHVSDKYGVKSHMRPTSKYARPHIENKTALAKPEMIKTKTVNDIDQKYLGYQKGKVSAKFPDGDKVGLSACKRPNVLPKQRPSDVTPAEWRTVKRRWVQREREFRNQSSGLKKLEKQGKIDWDRDSGIIYSKNPNGTRGPPYTGDNDAFGFTDAVTGKPVSPTVNRRINQEMQQLGVTQHNEHLGWDYKGTSRTPPATGGQSKFDTNRGIDKKILTGHSEPIPDVNGRIPAGREPVNTYNPLTYDPNRPYQPSTGQNLDNGFTTDWYTGGDRVL